MIDNKTYVIAEMKGIVLALQEKQEKEGEFAKVSCDVMERRIESWIQKLETER